MGLFMVSLEHHGRLAISSQGLFLMHPFECLALKKFRISEKKELAHRRAFRHPWGGLGHYIRGLPSGRWADNTPNQGWCKGWANHERLHALKPHSQSNATHQGLRRVPEDGRHLGTPPTV